ncbi:MAG: serine/threonine-protein kinase [Thiobacillus sp.]
MNIGRYEIIDGIGQGAMGTVYRARDPLIERTVAIKTVPIAQLQAEGADAESRFLREAQSAGRLSHPNIVTIYDVGEADGIAYIAMEYLPGTTLRDLMNKELMPLDLVLDTALQMLEALAFAHEHGVIHRDIKPANVVVVGHRGRVKLTDFGIAHLANSGQTQVGQMLGSPRYMSPEQAMGREVDGRSDIFSLGAVLYEMLTGRYAFDGDSLATIVYRVINDPPVAIASLRPQVPPALATLVGQMLNKNPAARPDARTLVSAFQGLMPTVPPRLQAACGKDVSPVLRLLAFTAPIGVFLLIGVSLIVIEHFLGLPGTSGPSDARAPAATQVASVAPPPPVVPELAPGDRPAPAERAGKENVGAPTAPGTDAYLEGLDRKRVELRIKRTELLLKYTRQHPDVVQIDAQLDRLRAERDRHLRQLQKHTAD